MSLNKIEKNARITMQMLATLENRQEISQRCLANELGIALGATNAHLQRCVEQGFILRAGTPVSRSGYRLTARGYLEKSRLNNEFLKQSFACYTDAQESCQNALHDCREKSFKQVYIFGAGPLAEVAYLTAMKMATLPLKGFLVPEQDQKEFLGLPVLASVDMLPPFSALLFCQLNDALQSYNGLRQKITEDRIIVPDVMKNALIMLPREKNKHDS